MTRDNSNKLRAVFLAALMFLWLFAGTVAFAGGAAAQAEIDPEDADETIEDGINATDADRFYQGQEVHINVTETEVDGDRVEQGDTVDILLIDDGDTNGVGEVNVRPSTEDDVNLTRLRTGQLDAGEDYTLGVGGSLANATDNSNSFDDDVDVGDAASWEIRNQQLDVGFEDNEVNAGDSVEVTFESVARSTYEVTIVEADGNLDEEEIEGIFDDALTFQRTDDDDNAVFEVGDSFFESDADFDGIDEGDYTFDFEVTDTNAEDTASITVLEEVDGDATFDQGTFADNRGDVVEITGTTEGQQDTVDVVIGEEEEDGYQLNVTITPNDDDEFGIEFNSFFAGVNATNPADEAQPDRPAVVTVAEDDDGDSLGTIEGANETVADADDLEIKLGQGSYDIVAIESDGVSGLTDLDNEDLEEFDVATMSLTERSTDGVQLWRSPTGTAGDIEELDDVAEFIEDGELTQTDTIAVTEEDRSSRSGDVIVHQFDASGIYGALDAEEDDGNLTNATFGVGDRSFLNDNEFAIEYEQQEPESNRRALTLNATATGVEDDQILIDDENNDLFVVIPSTDIRLDRGDNLASTPELRVDNDYDVDFTVNTTYLQDFTFDELDDEDDNQVVSTEFEAVDRELNFDTVGDEIVVSPSADAEITGDTNIAPGTEFTVRSRSTGEVAFLRQAEDTRVGEEGDFLGEFDFSDIESGTEFTASVRRQGFEDNAEQDGVIGEVDGPVFSVSDLEPQEAEVEQGTEIDVSATITNDGDETGTQDVSLTIDGDVLLTEEDVELDEGDDTVVEFEGVDTSDLPEGTYEHGIETEDDSATGTLTITVDEPADDDAEPDDGEPADDDGEPADDDGEPADDAEDQAGFGAVIALIALLGAALLAARRNAQN